MYAGLKFQSLNARLIGRCAEEKKKGIPSRLYVSSSSGGSDTEVRVNYWLTADLTGNKTRFLKKLYIYCFNDKLTINNKWLWIKISKNHFKTVFHPKTIFLPSAITLCKQPLFWYYPKIDDEDFEIEEDIEMEVAEEAGDANEVSLAYFFL